MTIRHTVHATVLAAAIALGCAALPAAASAAPAAAPTFAVTGADALAANANTTLDLWVKYTQTGSSDSRAQFDAGRDAIAAEAATRLGLDVGAMQAAWRNADSDHQVALLAAFTQLGTRYRRNSSSPGEGFDCSGLTSWAWGQAGVSLFHQSKTQINAAAALTRETAQAGDLVYYPGHVMLYLGIDNAIIHAPFTGRNVEVAFVSKNKAKSVRFGDPTA
ncbi:MAG: NlpC/P60 family protein [Ilumatobacteraceae bacterium]